MQKYLKLIVLLLLPVIVHTQSYYDNTLDFSGVFIIGYLTGVTLEYFLFCKREVKGGSNKND